MQWIKDLVTCGLLIVATFAVLVLSVAVALVHKAVKALKGLFE